MSTTQYFQSKPPIALSKCHDGVGDLVFYDLVPDNSPAQYIKFVHHDILPTGVSIGIHTHEGPHALEEWYYCVSGRGVMTLDGKEFDFCPGDICVCRAGGSHGLLNPYEEDLDIIVFYAEHL